MDAVTYAKCHKCGSTHLSILETHEESGWTDFAQHEVNGGAILPAGPFFFEAGDPVRVEMECGGCGHQWRSRRVVGSQASEPQWQP